MIKRCENARRAIDNRLVYADFCKCHGWRACRKRTPKSWGALFEDCIAEYVNGGGLLSGPPTVNERSVRLAPDIAEVYVGFPRKCNAIKFVKAIMTKFDVPLAVAYRWMVVLRGFNTVVVAARNSGSGEPRSIEKRQYAQFGGVPVTAVLNEAQEAIKQRALKMLSVGVC